MAENNGNPTLKVDFDGFDPMGLKATSELSKDVTKFGLDAARAFLNLICRNRLVVVNYLSGKAAKVQAGFSNQE